MDYQSILRKVILSEDIYGAFVSEIERLDDSPVSTLKDINLKRLHKTVGDAWENFCKEWLVVTNYCEQAWLLSEWRDHAQSLPDTYHLPKQDNGIDMVGRKGDEYYAIQCKFRGLNKCVSWKSLSTFIGLCERTGPWTKYIVMCSGRGISNKIKEMKSSKDVTIAKKSYMATTRAQWEQIAGLGLGYRLDGEQPSSSSDIITKPKPKSYILSQPTKQVSKNYKKEVNTDDVETIRSKRAQYYL